MISENPEKIEKKQNQIRTSEKKEKKEGSSSQLLVPQLKTKDKLTMVVNARKLGTTGCLNAKRDVLNTYQAIKSALLSHKNRICTFLRCGNLAYDP